VGTGVPSVGTGVSSTSTVGLAVGRGTLPPPLGSAVVGMKNGAGGSVGNSVATVNEGVGNSVSTVNEGVLPIVLTPVLAAVGTRVSGRVTMMVGGTVASMLLFGEFVGWSERT